MQTTPDTLNYMIAGYVAFTVIMAAYLFSLYKRWRNLEREYPPSSSPPGSGGEITSTDPYIADETVERPFTLFIAVHIFNRYRRWCNLESELRVLDGNVKRTDF